MKTKIIKRLERELVFEATLFSTGIASIILFYTDNLLLTLLLITLCLIRVKVCHKKGDTFFFVTAVIVGSFSEMLCINLGGVWRYTNPSFLGIPMWLPFAWALAVMMMKRVAEIFVKIEMR